MRRTHPRAIGEIMEDMVARTGLRPELQRHTAESAWPLVAGQHIAAFTRCVVLRGRTLHVYLNSAALKEELGYSRDTLRERINEIVGEALVDNVAIH